MSESVITDAQRARMMFIEKIIVQGVTAVITREEQFSNIHTLEVDYAAYGLSRHDAISALKRGLIMTLLLNLDPLKPIERPCPSDVWNALCADPSAELIRLSFKVSRSKWRRAPAKPVDAVDPHLQSEGTPSTRV